MVGYPKTTSRKGVGNHIGLSLEKILGRVQKKILPRVSEPAKGVGVLVSGTRQYVHGIVYYQVHGIGEVHTSPNFD